MNEISDKIPKVENPVPGEVGEVVDQRQKLTNLVASTNDLARRTRPADCNGTD